MSVEIYYDIGSFEAGATNTGSRNASYHCWCNIVDKAGEKVENSLNDVFYGKWSKCETVIKKWEKKCKSEGYNPFYSLKYKTQKP